MTELVAWYRLDGMDGGVTLDSSPFGNHAVVAGNASFQPGKLDQALSLDGIDDFLEAPGSPSLNAATNQLTVAFWVNFQSTGVNQVFLAKLATDGGTHASPFFDYSLHGLTSSAAPMSLRPRFWLRLNGASGQRTISSDTLIAAEGWHHLAGVYDGAAMRIYVDGVLAGGPLAVSGAAIDTHDSPLRIGAHGAGAELVKGSLDDVRIYRRGLTAEEIAALAR